jgi:hypothetical protein
MYFHFVLLLETEYLHIKICVAYCLTDSLSLPSAFKQGLAGTIGQLVAEVQVDFVSPHPKKLKKKLEETFHNNAMFPSYHKVQNDTGLRSVPKATGKGKIFIAYKASGL